ncbi:unnamed protein product [Hyaloperonospora brassicae]|uniref:Ubiquitin-like protease family profile domain-containing protein n=1 Tax=Hyaloperonospora brassicae TaxID=162125 RepID=A0AAV0UX43_HYABA|nr:unnamed protein product [Hyaloperonospora brassicae]
MLLQQSTQVALDDVRYQQRLTDASRYSRTLLQTFPVEVIQAPRRATAAGDTESMAQFRRSSGAEYVAYDKYRRRLYELNRDEYDFAPLLKRQKVALSKVNHLDEQNRGNERLFQRLQRVLSSCNERCGSLTTLSGCRGARNGPSTKRNEQRKTLEPGEQAETVETKEDDEVPVVESSCRDDAELKDTAGHKDRRRAGREDEIAELEEKLRLQRLSRTSKTDQLFYDCLAERETNILVEEVLLDEIYDLAADVFDEEEEKIRNKELPPDLLEIVEDALHEGPMEEILIQKYNVDIKRRHLQCLLPLQWLNDEVINFYFQMMSDRDEALVNAGVLPKRSHFFNSFFVTKVSENGYNYVNVRRWTRKIDLFAMDKIFMPVNVGNMHWCMAVIFMAEKRIQYYDSMHGSGAACLKVIMRYLHDESEHKKKTKFDRQGWELVTTTPDTPLQTNGSDCGVFSCMFADYVSRNTPLSFVQRDIPFHRHRMVLHITRGYIPLEEEGL